MVVAQTILKLLFLPERPKVKTAPRLWGTKMFKKYVQEFQFKQSVLYLLYKFISGWLKNKSNTLDASDPFTLLSCKEECVLSSFISKNAFCYFLYLDFQTAWLLIFWHSPNGAHLLPLFSFHAGCLVHGGQGKCKQLCWKFESWKKKYKNPTNTSFYPLFNPDI